MKKNKLLIKKNKHLIKRLGEHSTLVFVVDIRKHPTENIATGHRDIKEKRKTNKTQNPKEVKLQPLRQRLRHKVKAMYEGSIFSLTCL